MLSNTLPHILHLYSLESVERLGFEAKVIYNNNPHFDRSILTAVAKENQMSPLLMFQQHFQVKYAMENLTLEKN